MKLSIKNRLVIASVMLLCIIVCGCGGGGGGIKEIRVDPQGIYQSGFTFGGAHYTIIDQAPRGQLFLTPEPSMIIVPEGSDRVMYWQIGSGALFVAKVTATIRADIGFGTISGSGTIYATSMINGSRVTMTYWQRS